MDAHGNYTARGGGESGAVTAGWTTTVWIRERRATWSSGGEADTGIVWLAGNRRHSQSGAEQDLHGLGTTLIGRRFDVSD